MAFKFKRVKPGSKTYEFEDVTLPTNKFVIRASRYLFGVVVPASPESPAVITLPEGFKIDSDLTPLPAEDAAPEVLKPHHAGQAEGSTNAPSAAEIMSTPKGKRASDGGPFAGKQ